LRVLRRQLRLRGGCDDDDQGLAGGLHRLRDRETKEKERGRRRVTRLSSSSEDFSSGVAVKVAHAADAAFLLPSSPETTRSRRGNVSSSTFDVSACDENKTARGANRDGDVGYDAMTMTAASLAAYAAYATERLRNGVRRMSGRAGRTVPTSDSTRRAVRRWRTTAAGAGGRRRGTA